METFLTKFSAYKYYFDFVLKLFLLRAHKNLSTKIRRTFFELNVIFFAKLIFSLSFQTCEFAFANINFLILRRLQILRHVQMSPNKVKIAIFFLFRVCLCNIHQSIRLFCEYWFAYFISCSLLIHKCLRQLADIHNFLVKQIQVCMTHNFSAKVWLAFLKKILFKHDSVTFQLEASIAFSFRMKKAYSRS